MATSTASVPRDWREGRRFRAWELKQQGWTQRLIAAALGVTPRAVSQWMTRVREVGIDGLRRRIAPGRQPKLTAEQVAQLPETSPTDGLAFPVEVGGKNLHASRPVVRPGRRARHYRPGRL